MAEEQERPADEPAGDAPDETNAQAGREMPDDAESLAEETSRDRHERIPNPKHHIPNQSEAPSPNEPNESSEEGGLPLLEEPLNIEHRTPNSELQEHEQEPEPKTEDLGPLEPDTEHGTADTASEDEGAEEDEKRPAKELPPEALALCKAAIEAMLFSSADPITSRRLADALSDTGADGRTARKIVKELAAEYDESRRGFAIEEVAGGFQIMTRPEYAEYIANLRGSGSPSRLSQAALETLAVVAYKQPVTRADIEAIRGVQAGPLLRTLLQKGLVKITGRAEILGRPLIYGTTRKFLEHFGLKSLNELPKVEELPKP